MSGSPSKMTFAEKMMTKMGHKQGQGLGKNGEGIVNPIQDSGNAGRTGIGFEDIAPKSSKGWKSAPAAPEPTTTPDFESQFIKINNNSEPAYVHSLFGHGDNRVEDVFTPQRNYAGEAWVKLSTPDQAREAVKNYHHYMFGPYGHSKINVMLMRAEDVPKASAGITSYSEWLQQPQLKPACTVLVTQLPPSGPIKNVGEMIDDLGMVDGYDEDDEDDDELHGVQNMRAIQDISVVVRFECISDARHFHDVYNGDYRKNNTLHVEFRPDSEMADLLKGKGSKDTLKLFVSDCRGLTPEDISKAVHLIAVNDVQINPGGFAFAFLAAVDAVAIVDKYPNGCRLANGRKIYFKEPKDKKDAASFDAARKLMAATSAPPAAAAAASSFATAPWDSPATPAWPTPAPAPGPQSTVSNGLQYSAPAPPQQPKPMSWASKAAGARNFNPGFQNWAQKVGAAAPGQGQPTQRQGQPAPRRFTMTDIITRTGSMSLGPRRHV